MTVGYLVKKDYVTTVKPFLNNQFEIFDHLILCEGEYSPLPWVKNVYHDVEIVDIASIGAAAKILATKRRFWSLYDIHSSRRAHLILEKLPKIRYRPVNFFEKTSLPPLGMFALLAPDKMLVASKSRSPFALGNTNFLEFPEAPSRAYLKLMEALMTLGLRPDADDLAIELGAAPGGWTWVLEKLARQVYSYDRAELDYPKRENVSHQVANAFAVDPHKQEYLQEETRRRYKKTWFFSDLIAYPDALFECYMRWIDSGKIDYLLGTIKFQGEFNPAELAPFREIPNSKIFHLFHNKNELTLFWQKV